jgi:hypothetical protein
LLDPNSVAAMQIAAYALALLVVALPSAFCAGWIAVVAAARGCGPVWAIILGASYSAGSMATMAAPRLCGAQLAACLGFAAMSLVVPQRGDESRSLRISPARAIVIGTLLGWTLAVEPLAWPMTIGVLVLLVARAANPSSLAMLAFAAMLPLQLMMTYHRLTTGSAWPAARSLVASAQEPAELLLARWIIGSPLLALLAVVLWDRWERLLARQPVDSWELIAWATIAAQLALACYGGDGQPAWTAGPLLMLPALPLAWLLLAPLVGGWRRIAWFVALVSPLLLAPLLLAPQVPLIAGWHALAHGELLYDMRRFDLAVDDPRTAAYLWPQRWGLTGGGGVMPLLLWWWIGALGFWLVARRRAAALLD